MANDKISATYIGTDYGYWDSLKRRFESTYSSEQFDFSIHSDLKLFHPDQMFAHICKSEIDMVFIDFSFNENKCLRLAKLLRKNQFTRRISTTALFEYLAPKEMISRSLMAGIRINQIKSVEISNVIHDAFVFYSPEEAIEPETALAKIDEDAYLLQEVRIAYATKEYFRVETNNKFNEGQLVELDCHPLRSIMKSHMFRVSDIEDRNLYYDSRYGLRLNYIYTDHNLPENERPPLAKNEEGPTPKEIKELVEEIQHNIKKWVDLRLGRTVPKWTKVLLIDQELKMLSSKKDDWESYPFSIDIQTSLRTKKIPIEKRLPNIIGYALNEESEDKTSVVADNPKFHPFNDLKVLALIIEKVKSEKDYDPIVVIFETTLTSEELQNRFKYPKLISYQDEINMNMISHFAKIHKRNLGKLKKISKAEDKERVYFQSTDEDTVATLRRYVKLQAISETHIYLTSDSPIRQYTVFEIDFISKMLITIVPMSSSDEFKSVKNCYRALITCTGEEEKAKLRRYVYEIYLKEKVEQEQLELAEFKKLNETVKAQRIADEQSRIKAEEQKQKDRQKQKEEEKEQIEKAKKKKSKL